MQSLGSVRRSVQQARQCPGLLLQCAWERLWRPPSHPPPPPTCCCCSTWSLRAFKSSGPAVHRLQPRPWPGWEASMPSSGGRRRRPLSSPPPLPPPPPPPNPLLCASSPCTCSCLSMGAGGGQRSAQACPSRSCQVPLQATAPGCLPMLLQGWAAQRTASSCSAWLPVLPGCMRRLQRRPRAALALCCMGTSKAATSSSGGRRRLRRLWRGALQRLQSSQ
jgi:hypothetical protein